MNPSWQVIPNSEAGQCCETGLVIDVRSPEDFQRCHLPGSVNVPLDTLDVACLTSLAQSHGLKPGDRIFLMCQGGIRARKAADALVAQSPYPLGVIDGGINGCGSAGVALAHEA